MENKLSDYDQIVQRIVAGSRMNEYQARNWLNSPEVIQSMLKGFNRKEALSKLGIAEEVLDEKSIATKWFRDPLSGLILPPRIDIETFVLSIDYSLSLSKTIEKAAFKHFPERHFTEQHYPLSGGEGRIERKIYLLSFQHYLAHYFQGYFASFDLLCKGINNLIRQMGLEVGGLWELTQFSAKYPQIQCAKPIISIGSREINGKPESCDCGCGSLCFCPYLNGDMDRYRYMHVWELNHPLKEVDLWFIAREKLAT